MMNKSKISKIEKIESQHGAVFKLIDCYSEEINSVGEVYLAMIEPEKASDIKKHKDNKIAVVVVDGEVIFKVYGSEYKVGMRPDFHCILKKGDARILVVPQGNFFQFINPALLPATLLSISSGVFDENEIERIK